LRFLRLFALRAGISGADARRAGAGSAPVVRLAGRELLRLPETLPREGRALDASRNRLPALPRALPGWAALRSLNLGSNRLTHLPVRPDH
jgi:hypothetical protein